MKNYQKLVTSILLSAGLALNSLSVTAAPQIVEKVAAIVNNDVVLESDINRMMESIKMSVPDQSQLPTDAELRSQVLERLVLESLMLQEAEKLKIRVSNEQLEQEISDIAAQNGMTIDQLRGQLTTAKISYPAYQDRIKKEILIDETRARIVRDRVNITPQEVDILVQHMLEQPADNFELNISQILVPLAEHPSLADIRKAQSTVKTILTKLSKKADFQTLSATYSAAPNALEGGAMGWKRINELPSAFAEEIDVKTARKGQIIGPIRSGVGFHIVRVNDVRGAEKQIPDGVNVTEYHARHILLKSTVLTTDEALINTLNGLRNDVLEGKMSFESAATAYSEDPGSASTGGDLGWSIPDRYDEGFRNALLKMQAGEISEPIKSNFGWHLIQLVETREVDHTEYALKDQAYRMIFNKKFTEEAQNWMHELRAGAYVNVRDENQDADSSN